MKKSLLLLIFFLVSCTNYPADNQSKTPIPPVEVTSTTKSGEDDSSGLVTATITPTEEPERVSVSWESIGPGGGGFMPAMAFSPPNTLYIGCDVGGVFRSRDGGESYQIINEGLQDYNVLVIAVHPKDPDIVYLGAGSGIYKSIDGGDHWEWLRNGFPPIERYGYSAPITSIAIDPSDPETVYAGVGDSNWHRLGQGRIYKSQDAGSSWDIIEPAIPSDAIVYSITVHPGDSSVLFISTDYGVLISEDGGEQWKEINEGLPHTNTRKLVMDPTDPDVLYLTIHSTPNEHPWQGGVYKSIDGGESWQPKNVGLGKHVGRPGDDRRITGNYENVLINPQDPNILYVGAASWWNTGIYKSTNGGESWRNTVAISNSEPGWINYNDWSPSQGESMAIDPNDPDRVFFADAWQVIATQDGGGTWQQIYTNQLGDDPLMWGSRGLETTVVYDIEVSPGNSDLVYQGYADVGIHRSDDGGKTFYHFTPGLADDFFDIEIDPQDPNVLYASVTRWTSKVADLVKSVDAGQTWQMIGFPPSDQVDLIISKLVLDPTSPIDSRVIYAGSKGDGVFKSSDGGLSWMDINSGLGENGNRFVSSLVTDPTNPNLLYAGVAINYRTLESSDQYGGVYKTDDGGQTWQKVDENMPYVLDLAVDHFDTQIVYAATREYLDSDNDVYFEGGVYQSLDGGSSWRRVFDDPFVMVVETDPHTPGVVYAGTGDHPYHDQSTGNGLFRSDDQGETWYPLNDGLSNLSIWAFEIDPNTPNIIYAGTGGTGVFKGIVQD